jgi:hypothetical protein
MGIPTFKSILCFSVLAGMASSVLFMSCGPPVELYLTENGRSNYRIVLFPDATEADEKGARELQSYLHQISGAEIPIIPPPQTEEDSLIWIASSGHALHFPYTVAWDKLEDDGFTIRTRGTDLIIAGGKEKGSLYGVYTFLETVLGCREYSAGVQVIPKKETIRVPEMKVTQIPVIRYREIHMPDAMDRDYGDWHKLDTRADRLENWGLWVHTFDDFIPPETYFSSHPEYFSLINGERVPQYQLCLTNQEVFRLVVADLKRRMEENPHARYWSVSQNDTYGSCQCPSCLALDKKYGGPSGTMIHFVNRVAAEFPDKCISTLAYQYTRTAPKNIKPAENVIIVLCTIECNRSEPIASDARSRDFRKDITEWSGLTDHILVWDYVVQFRNLISPFPNLRVLRPNIRFFARHHTRMLFEQGSGFSRSEFHELRTYLLAKLLWNPDADIAAVQKDFLQGFYGDAAPFIETVIRTMHDTLERSGEELVIYGNPWMPMNGYLSPGRMDAYIDLMDRAEAAVAGRTEYLERVRTARLPLEYGVLEQAKKYGIGPRGYFQKVGNGEWEVRPEMRQRLEQFVLRCRTAGFALIEEHGYTPDDYKADVERFLQINMPSHLGLFKPVTLMTESSPKYPAGGAAALTDGLKGLEDYHCNWLGFEGEDLEAVIDLTSIQPVQAVSTDFLQDIVSWVFLPVRVEYGVSRDGKTFQTVAVIENTVPDNRNGPFIQSFKAECKNLQARFVRIKAVSMKTCPDWHIGKGGKSWIFADEVIIH